MIVLGIADNHDAGAAVVIDGRLVSAVNQERIDRIKQSGAFPWGAIDEALSLAGVRELAPIIAAAMIAQEADVAISAEYASFQKERLSSAAGAVRRRDEARAVARARAR